MAHGKEQSPLLRFVKLLFSLVGFIFRTFVETIFSAYYGEGRCVSKPSNRLLLFPATELSQEIRSRRVKCAEVIEAYIDRIQEVNVVTNCLVDQCYVAAVKRALEIDEILDSGHIPDHLSPTNAPFLGVPLTAKEAIPIEGLAFASGVVARMGVTSAKHDAGVQRMVTAGAIPIANTNVSELCMWYEAANMINGRTSNAYDSSRMVGGSSGGEGCLISAAGSVFGLGSDIGGSIRMPAYFNGIFGHKPTWDMVPWRDQFPCAQGRPEKLLCSGPLCRYASDLMPMLKVLVGPSNAQTLQLDRRVDLRKVRFFSMESLGAPLVGPMDYRLKHAQEELNRRIESELGVHVERVTISKMRLGFAIWGAFMTTPEGGKAFSNMMAINQDGVDKVNCLWELAKKMFNCSNHTVPAILLGIAEDYNVFISPSREETLRQIGFAMKQQIQEMLGDDAVLLCPSHPIPAPYHNQALMYPFNAAYTASWNMTGFPITQCPLGLTPGIGKGSGLPMGIQVIGSTNQDALTIAVANFIEDQFGGWVPPPGHRG